MNKKPNVLIISIDTLRADFLPQVPPLAPDFQRPDLPTLAMLRDRGVTFVNLWSTNTYTTAAHASMFTGMYPPQHGVRGFFAHRLKPEPHTLAEVFSNQGYATSWYSDTPLLFKATGLDRGFHDEAADEIDLMCHMTAHLRHGTGPAFGFMHLFDCHAPYLHSPKTRPSKFGDFAANWHSIYRERNGDRSFYLPVYIEGVVKFDQGRLLNSVLEWLEHFDAFDGDWRILILSDHGEGRTGEEGREFGHEGRCFDEVLRVPLIFIPDKYPPVWPDNRPDPYSEEIYSAGKLAVNNYLYSLADVYWMAQGHFPKPRDVVYAETWRRDRAGTGMGSFDVGADQWEMVGVSNDAKVSLEWVKKGDALPRFSLIRRTKDWYEDKPIPDCAVTELDLGLVKPCLNHIIDVNQGAVELEDLAMYKELEDQILNIIEFFSGTVVVWGAGEHTKMLLRETSLAELNIIGVVDSDPEKQGGRFEELGAVVSPAELFELNPDSVLVSSHDFQDDILKDLYEMGWSGQVFLLYGNETEGDDKEVEDRLRDLGYIE